MYMQDISLLFILVGKTFASKSHVMVFSDGVAAATLSLSKERTSVSLFCSCSGNIIFIIPACTSRRIAEYELKAYLFYKMLWPP